MGISKLHLEILKQLLDQIPSRPVPMISLGYPDALVTAESVKSIFGPDVLRDPVYRDDSEKIKNWHGVSSHNDNGHRLISPIYCGTSRGLDHELVQLPNTGRISSIAQESTIWVIAQKTHDRPVVWPMQTKYKDYQF